MRRPPAPSRGLRQRMRQPAWRKVVCVRQSLSKKFFLLSSARAAELAPAHRPLCHFSRASRRLLCLGDAKSAGLFVDQMADAPHLAGLTSVQQPAAPSLLVSALHTLENAWLASAQYAGCVDLPVDDQDQEDEVVQNSMQQAMKLRTGEVVGGSSLELSRAGSLPASCLLERTLGLLERYPAVGTIAKQPVGRWPPTLQGRPSPASGWVSTR